jgi:hypothetical protein
MAFTKTISGRKLRRKAVEEQLAPGESVQVTKEGGKVFELRRIDPGQGDINAGLDRLLAEMPPEGKRVRTDLARIIVEDRE